MAKDKERSINPAAAQRKAEKQKALRKGELSSLVSRHPTKDSQGKPRSLHKGTNDLPTAIRKDYSLRSTTSSLARLEMAHYHRETRLFWLDSNVMSIASGKQDKRSVDQAIPTDPMMPK